MKNETLACIILSLCIQAVVAQNFEFNRSTQGKNRDESEQQPFAKDTAGCQTCPKSDRIKGGKFRGSADRRRMVFQLRFNAGLTYQTRRVPRMICLWNSPQLITR